MWYFESSKIKNPVLELLREWNWRNEMQTGNEDRNIEAAGETVKGLIANVHDSFWEKFTETNVADISKTSQQTLKLLSQKYLDNETAEMKCSQKCNRRSLFINSNSWKILLGKCLYALYKNSTKCKTLKTCLAHLFTRHYEYFTIHLQKSCLKKCLKNGQAKIQWKHICMIFQDLNCKY